MAILHSPIMDDVHITSTGAPTPILTGFLPVLTTLGTSTSVQVVDWTTLAAAAIPDFATIDLYSAKNKRKFYIYFIKDNVIKKPFVADRSGIRVDISSTANATAVADAIKDKLNSDYSQHFSVANIADALTITFTENGLALLGEDGSTFDLNTLIGIVPALQRVNGYVLKPFNSGEELIYKQIFVSIVVNLNSSNTQLLY